MRQRHLIASLILVWAASTARAADRTWNGSGSDSNWSTAANWGGAAPVADDALFFGGTAKAANTNDLFEGTSFAGITFNSGAIGFTLSGNGITLGGDIVNNDNDTQTINLPMTLDSTRTFNAVSGPVTVNGQLTGSGGIAKESGNYLTLTASNSYEGATLINTGVVRIAHASALGSTAGATTVNTLGRARLEIAGGITVAEPINLTGGNNSSRCLQNVSGSNVITGLISSPNCRVGVDNSSTMVISGGVSGNPFFVINGNGTMIFNTTPLALGTLYADDVGLTILDVAGSTWGGSVVAKGTLRMGLANVLPPASYMRIGLGYGPAGTLDLNGYNQRVNKLYTDATLAGTRRVISATPALLTVDQSVSSIFDGGFTGQAGLCKTGTGTLTLTNATPWTTTGDVIVSNGTLVVAANCTLGNSTNIVVGGGTLELQNGSALSDLARVVIADGGAKVKVGASLTEAIGRLVLGEAPVQKGTYGMTGSGADVEDDLHFSGAGLLQVLYDPPIVPTNHVWDAEGADTMMSTAANWEGDAVAPFGGTTHAVFATGGSTATVDTAVSLYGMTFNRDANFTLANGDGSLTLGLGGIVATPLTATSRSYTIEEEMSLIANQDWLLTRNGAGVPTLSVSGAISDGEQSFGITQSGNGVLVLSGGNTYDGSTIVKTSGVLRISNAAALGSTNGATVVENGGYIQVSGNVTVEEPLTINGDGAVSYAGALRSIGGSNVWSGTITCNGSRIRAETGSLDIVGGVSGSQCVLGANGGAWIRVSEKPINIGGANFFSHSAGGAIILAVTNNTWAYLEVGGSYLRTDLPNVLPPLAILQQGAGSAKSSLIDLNGNDQTVGQLRTGWSGPEPRILYSAAPVTLTVNQSANTDYNASITGTVSLIKTGTGNLTISGTNSTYGSYVVNAGTLTVNAVGTLGANSTNLTVNGGTLSLQNSAALADTATLRIADGGAKVDLASGVNEAVGYLFLGGVQKRVGTYGSTGSAALIKDDAYFSGTGILTVLHDKSGTLIKVW